MTRTAAVMGVLLAILLFLEAVPSQSPWWVAAVLILVAAAGTLRGSTVLHLALCALGLVVLGRALPFYFRTHRLWPFLAMIALSCLSLGFGLLGFLLDRYHAPEEPDRTL